MPRRQRTRDQRAAGVAERAHQWQAESPAFFDWYNATVEADGLMLGAFRQF